MTKYMVLVRDESGYWHAGADVPARSAKAAVRAVSEGTEGGTFVAAPARSWKPVTVTVETKTTLKFQ